jgi:1-acyl-sn-glycerol-3-phosphate acyltransferase
MATQEWRYDTMQDLNQGMVERLRRCPREPDMLVYGLRWAAAFGIRATLRGLHRLKVVGRENLPRDGSYVLIANHTSHLDTLCLLSALPWKRLHRAFPAAAADCFFTRSSRIAISAAVVNALPFDREVHYRQSLNLCKELLASPGTILIFFPEGTRSLTGEIGEFRPGIGALLAGTDVPVVPCHIAGAFEAWPKGKILPQPGRLRLAIGTSRTYAALSQGKDSAQFICRELRRAVLELAAIHRTQ